MTHRLIPAGGRGFTLIEMLVTVTIVALLSTVAFPMLELTKRRSNERELRDALRQIRTALDNYKQAGFEGRIAVAANQSGYPPSLDVLVAGVTDAKSPNRDQKIYFLRRIPKDPLIDPLATDSGGDWGLRSYASAPNDPQPGADVFDVYSRSNATGLNGIAYKDW
ncbi:type II secretion system protein [Actimicrobium sp. CCI2.3]|uniref:type II secretion system protein n=1 Tax=Actimicrobium sp. CCI2.3 TaxID=3048616 RepID=UPI002AB4E9A9|nr:type II secretion system protein [Actimicrobium sp. CCI2.3]MDY7574599.1 type II secretion system protein [Actimicrobium sp. CCI2.3]MEB0023902.1 type II secretion system protein [Actimicrobium sp. CCI2.3]